LNKKTASAVPKKELANLSAKNYRKGEQVAITLKLVQLFTLSY